MSKRTEAVTRLIKMKRTEAVTRLLKIHQAQGVLVSTSRKLMQAIELKAWDAARELTEQQHRNLDDIAADLIPIPYAVTEVDR